MVIKIIEREIEFLRELLHITALDKGISHPDVLAISEMLDKKLNEYSKIQKLRAIT